MLVDKNDTRPTVIAVMSGKGGVGKSSISIMLATILSEKHKCLLLDFDICGPSCVTSLNAIGEIKKAKKGLVPIFVTTSLHLLSMGLMIKSEDVVIWRGPKKLSLLNMFYDSIDSYDYVIIDTPPGLSEEHNFLIGKDIKSLIVTTSQNVALSDSIKAIDFCRQHDIEILGVIENLSGYECTVCKHISNPFAKNGGKEICKYYSINDLCILPIDLQFGEHMDNGTVLDNYKDLKTYAILKSWLEAKLECSKV